MNDRELSELFERFRRTGDGQAFSAVFDRAAPELWRVARRLSRSRTDAEDLLQATWLAAIDRAASFDAKRAIVPWLIGILVRQAGLVRRRAGRVESVAELERSGEVDPARGLASQELAEALLRALEHLTPAEREVLVPALLDERRAAEIAREIGQTPNAVRVRLSRGLARLRRILPAGLSLGLVVLLDRRSLAAVRRRAIETACARGGSAAAALAPSAIGVVVLQWALGVALVLAAGVWAARQVLPALRAGGDARTVAASLPAQAESEQRLDAPAPDDGPRAATQVAVAQVERESRGESWIVRGSVRGLAPDAAGAFVSAESVRASHPVGDAIRLPLEGAGDERSYEFDVTQLFASEAGAPEDVRVTVDHPRYVPETVLLSPTSAVTEQVDERIRHVLELTTTLQLAAVIQGSIQLCAGSNAENYEVKLVREGEGTPVRRSAAYDSFAIGETFVLRTRESGSFLLAVHADECRAITMRVEATRGLVQDLGTIHLDAGASITGVVPDIAASCKGVWVCAEPVHEPGSVSGSDDEWTGNQLFRKERATRTDEHGRFAIPGLDPGEYELSVTGCIGNSATRIYSRDAFERVLARAPSADVVVPMETSFVALRIRGPVSGEDELRSLYHAPETEPNSMTTSMRWDLLRFAYRAGAVVRFTFEADGFESWQRDVRFPASGLEDSIDVDMARIVPARLVLEVTEEGGGAVDHVSVNLVPRGGTPSAKTGFTPGMIQVSAKIADGVFTFGNMNPGAYTASIDGYHEGRFNERFLGRATLELELASGVTTRCEATLPVEGRLRIHVVGSRAQDLPAKFRLRLAGAEEPLHLNVMRVSNGTQSLYGDGLRSGTNEVYDTLAPGNYELSIERKDRAPLVLPVAITARRMTEIQVDLDAP